jgi:hypothetical protein
MDADAISEFNSLKAEVVAAAYGRTSGEADSTVKNLKIGSTEFRAAFAKIVSTVDYRTHGISERCDAVFYLPTSLSVTIDENTVVTYLPTDEKFMVLPDQSPGLVLEAHRKVRLRRLEA